MPNQQGSTKPKQITCILFQFDRRYREKATFARVNGKLRNRVIVKCHFASRSRFEIRPDMHSRNIDQKPFASIDWRVYLGPTTFLWTVPTTSAIVTSSMGASPVDLLRKWHCERDIFVVTLSCRQGWCERRNGTKRTVLKSILRLGFLALECCLKAVTLAKIEWIMTVQTLSKSIWASFFNILFFLCLQHSLGISDVI